MKFIKKNKDESFIGIGSISDKVCDMLIEAFEKSTNKSYGISGEKQDFSIKKSVDVTFNPNDFPELLEEVTPQIKKYIDNYFPYLTECCEPFGYVEPFNVQKYLPGEGFYAWHYERCAPYVANRVLVWMIYLNDVTNAGTEWHFQKIKTEAKKGDIVVWPVDFTHVHRGIVSDTQIKYIATGWLGYLPNA